MFHCSLTTDVVLALQAATCVDTSEDIWWCTKITHHGHKYTLRVVDRFHSSFCFNGLILIYITFFCFSHQRTRVTTATIPTNHSSMLAREMRKCCHQVSSAGTSLMTG